MAPGVAFVGGKLNLKGDKKKNKKKSKKSKHSKKFQEWKLDDVNADAKNNETKQMNSNNDIEDEMTEAEKRSLRFKKQNESRDFEKLGEKSHRERIEEFNAHLGSLTELNDIPRVSAAGNG